MTHEFGRTDQHTRTRIADKAKGAFRQHGWGLTPPQAADITGIDPGTMTQHFPTLRSLVRAAYAAEILALQRSIDNATTAIEAAETLHDHDVAINNFITDVAALLECRPVLIISFMPFIPDPWDSCTNGTSEFDGSVFDTLLRTLYDLLNAHWQYSRPALSKAEREDSAQLAAKHHMFGIFGTGANKRTGSEIAKVVLSALL
jgi:AcrR family transcriptional regulator